MEYEKEVTEQDLVLLFGASVSASHGAVRGGEALWVLLSFCGLVWAQHALQRRLFEVFSTGTVSCHCILCH